MRVIESVLCILMLSFAGLTRAADNVEAQANVQPTKDLRGWGLPDWIPIIGGDGYSPGTPGFQGGVTTKCTGKVYIRNATNGQIFYQLDATNGDTAANTTDSWTITRFNADCAKISTVIKFDYAFLAGYQEKAYLLYAGDTYEFSIPFGFTDQLDMTLIESN